MSSLLQPFAPDAKGLIDLRDMFRTSISGSSKAFVTSSGSLRVTRTSNRIVESLRTVLDNPMCEFALQVMATFLSTHQDGGLQLAGLMFDMLACGGLAQFGDTVKNTISKSFEEQTLRVDISSAAQILAVTNTVLGSKLSCMDFQDHSVKIVTAFLQTVPDNPKTCCRLGLKVVQGMDFSLETVPGVMHHFPEFWTVREKLDLDNAKVLLLNVQLKEDMGEMTEVSDVKLDPATSTHQREAMRALVGELAGVCARLGVSVVANQRVICPELQDIFRQKGVVAIERLGRETAQRLQCLTKGHVVQNITAFVDMSVKDQLRAIGTVQRIRFKEHMDKPYLHFTDDSRTCMSVFVTHWNEEECIELEVGSLLLK